MKVGFLLIILLSGLSLGITEDYTLYPGKGIGKVRLGKTTEQEIKALYGENYQREEQLYTAVSLIDGKEVAEVDTPYYYINYPDQGLKFHFRNIDNHLIRIIASANFPGKTMQNIRPIRSIMGETLPLFGKPQVIYDQDEIQYAFRGIAFVVRCTDCNKLSRQEINSLSIQEIIVAKTVKLPPVMYTE